MAFRAIAARIASAVAAVRGRQRIAAPESPGFQEELQNGRLAQAPLRVARTMAVAVLAGTAAAGGFALTGLEASLVTAPLTGEDEQEVFLMAGTAGVSETPIWRHLSNEEPSELPVLADPDLSFVDEQRRLTREEVKLLARQAGFPEHTLEEVAEVAWCESRFDPAATNDGVRGLMQIHVMWFSYAGVSLDLWADPIVNMEVALAVYHYDLAKGYEPWTQWQCRPGGRHAPARVVNDDEDEAEDEVRAAAAEDAGDEDVEATNTTPVPDKTPPATPKAEATETPPSADDGDDPTPEAPPDEPPIDEPDEE